MNAKIILLDEQGMQNTSGQFGIVCGYRQGPFSEPYISLKDLIKALQESSDNDARVIAEDNCSNEHEASIDMKVISARWCAVNDIIKDLKTMV